MEEKKLYDFFDEKSKMIFDQNNEFSKDEKTLYKIVRELEPELFSISMINFEKYENSNFLKKEINDLEELLAKKRLELENFIRLTPVISEKEKDSEIVKESKKQGKSKAVSNEYSHEVEIHFKIQTRVGFFEAFGICKFNLNGNAKVKILKGSTSNCQINDIYNNRFIHEHHNNLLREGFVIEENGAHLFVSDCEHEDVSSLSASASFVAGSLQNGKIKWLTKSGEPIGKYIDSVINHNKKYDC
jgi:hypothetical protein